MDNAENSPTVGTRKCTERPRNISKIDAQQTQRKQLLSTACCARFYSTGVTPYGGIKCRWGGSKSATFHKKPAISQKWCKIDTWFLLKSNRKSYALYRMVTLSMTLSAPIVPSAACPVPISATCSCPVDGAAHLVKASVNSQFGRFSPLANVV